MATITDEKILRREKSFDGNFHEVFQSFREVFRSFRDLFGAFGRVWDAFRRIWKQFESFQRFPNFFEFSFIFESFFNVSGGIFFSRHNTPGTVSC